MSGKKAKYFDLPCFFRLWFRNPRDGTLTKLEFRVLGERSEISFLSFSDEKVFLTVSYRGQFQTENTNGELKGMTSELRRIHFVLFCALMIVSIFLMTYFLSRCKAFVSNGSDVCRDTILRLDFSSKVNKNCSEHSIWKSKNGWTISTTLQGCVRRAIARKPRH